MKKFLLRTLLFLSPFFLFYLPYLTGDPFKVLYHYDVYYPLDGSPLWFNNNRTYVSTMMYVQNKDIYNWNSFIFGSSRSGFYRIDHWKKYIGEDSRCFHFDGYGESLYNMYRKLQFIDGKSEIKNALFCIDEMALFQDKAEPGHLWIPAPILEDYRNWSQFHMASLKAYSKYSFIRTYIDFSLFHKTRPYMVESGVLDTVPHGAYNIATNECGETLPLPYKYENDSSFYTPEKKKQFYARPDTIQYAKPILKSRHIQMLTEMKDILVRNHTNYQFVINPVYDQKKLAKEDMTILENIFGDNLFDFSGRNLLTEDYRNYGDLAHFRQHVAAEVMRIMYEKDNNKRAAMLDSLYNIQ